MIEFIAAVYNEEAEISGLLEHIYPYVEHINIVSDGSTDDTDFILGKLIQTYKTLNYKRILHTGLPETVKHEALQMVQDGSWALMLDADERFDNHVLEQIRDFVNSDESKDIDYVYFRQVEIIDKVGVREFQKAKLFRKEAISFPLNNIHADDVFTGNGIFKEDWVVLHRKGSYKQVIREREYLNTYKKLLVEGHIDKGRYEWLVGLHHYVKPHG